MRRKERSGEREREGGLREDAWMYTERGWGEELNCVHDNAIKAKGG